MESHCCCGLWENKIYFSIYYGSFLLIIYKGHQRSTLPLLFCTAQIYPFIFLQHLSSFSFFSSLWIEDQFQAGKVAGRVCSLVVTAGYFCVDWIEHLWSNNIPSIMHISCVFAAIFQICFGESFSHTFGCHCTPWQIRFHFLRQLLLMFNSGPIHTL